MSKSAKSVDKTGRGDGNRAGKYLTFMLSSEEYGIGILKIREIIPRSRITALPQTPEYVKGVINLRGKVIPVIDLRRRFGMGKIDYTERTCIIVIEALSSRMEKCWEVKNCKKSDCPAHGSSDLRCWMTSGTFCRDEIQGTFHEKIAACRKCNFYQKAQSDRAVIIMGILVDAVSEVLNIKSTEIEDAPSFGFRLNTDYILGMAKMEGGVKILLDIDRVLSAGEMDLIEKAA